MKNVEQTKEFKKVIIKNQASQKDNEFVVLLQSDGLINFVLEVEDKDNSSLNFRVYEITAWSCEENTPLEMDLYVRGFVKRYGCSHVWFGEEDENEKTDGYLHICGRSAWENHSNVMREIFSYASSMIETDRNFD